MNSATMRFSGQLQAAAIAAKRGSCDSNASRDACARKVIESSKAFREEPAATTPVVLHLQGGNNDSRNSLDDWAQTQSTCPSAIS